MFVQCDFTASSKTFRRPNDPGTRAYSPSRLIKRPIALTMHAVKRLSNYLRPGAPEPSGPATLAPWSKPPSVTDSVSHESFNRSSFTDSQSSSSSSDEYDAPPINVSEYRLPSKQALFSETVRLQTFRRWEVVFLSPESLAKAGFFYRGVNDQVQCAFCLIIISQWEPSDDPVQEHKKHAPQCPFMRGLPVGNIPVTSEAALQDLRRDGTSLTVTSTPSSGASSSSVSPTFSSSSSSASRQSEGPNDMPWVSSFPLTSPRTDLGGEDVCGRFATHYRPNAFAENESPANYGIKTRQGTETCLSKLPVQPHNTTGVPTMVTYDNRLNTYKDWPSGLSQKPAQLAEAGFFYLGTGDHVKCFRCEGALKNWEPEDQPWTEHARWFSKCTFLLDMKGEEYVKDVLEKFCDEAPPHRSNSGEPVSQPASMQTGSAACMPKPELYRPMDEKPKNEATLCKVCLDQEMGIVFLPCGHLAVCPGCAAALNSCPICRKQIQATVRVYMT